MVYPKAWFYWGQNSNQALKGFKLGSAYFILCGERLLPSRHCSHLSLHKKWISFSLFDNLHLDPVNKCFKGIDWQIPQNSIPEFQPCFFMGPQNKNVGLASCIGTQNKKGATVTKPEGSSTGNRGVQVTAVASLGPLKAELRPSLAHGLSVLNNERWPWLARTPRSLDSPVIYLSLHSLNT